MIGFAYFQAQCSYCKLVLGCANMIVSQLPMDAFLHEPDDKITIDDIPKARPVCMICQWQMHKLKKWFDKEQIYGKCKSCMKRTNVRLLGDATYCYFCFLDRDLK